jgi:ornithine cyclodeaminase/alanine dehydrogenase-like protein (mu-crystallin family)
MAGVRVLGRDEVRAALDMPSLIDAMGRAFTAYTERRAELPSVIHLDVPERHGEVHVKAGYLHGGPHFAVKVAGGFPDNATLGLPTADGMIVVFDAETGTPVAILLDGGYLTDARTGAAGGLAARYLAPEAIPRVAVIGTGIQARFQVEALAHVRRFEEVRIWGRDRGRAELCVADVRALPTLPSPCEVRAVPSVQEAVDDAVVVITATAARAPLVRAEWLSPGAHVTAVGSDGPDKQELDIDVLARADLVVADSLAQCIRIGEIHHAVASGVLREEDVVELGDITAGRHPGRTPGDGVTICDLTGVGVQDVAAATLVMERAADRGRLIQL